MGRSAFHQRKDKPNANRKYGAEDVARWRQLKREERLTDKEIAARENCNQQTVTKLFQEF